MDRLIPLENGVLPISGLDELYAHLHDLLGDASTPFNVKLLDDIELQLTGDSLSPSGVSTHEVHLYQPLTSITDSSNPTETNTPPLLPRLLPPLAQILKTTPQDPSPLLSLARKLLSPLSFPQTLAVVDAPSVLTALASPLPGANILALDILHKASRTPADAAALAAIPHLLDQLVTRWLDTPDVGVGERAARVLGDLLEVEHRGGDGGAGGRILWRLLNPLLPVITTSASRHDRQCSLAQGRLLRLLTRLAPLDLPAVTSTLSPALLPLPSAVASTTGRGILQWAALAMVDRSDALMHLTLIDFFESLVSVMRVAALPPDAQHTVRTLVRAAIADDPQLAEALRTLPNRTVEDEAEALRVYINDIL